MGYCNPGETDGRFYGLNDMVKAGCGDCAGCSACCRDMGDSVVLNPYDVCRLADGLGTSFERLLNGKVTLGVQDGMVLPNLAMGPDGACGFLDGNGRCMVHALRPGICRLFPLGRDYGEEKIRYIFLVNGCKKANRSKVKVRKWIDTPDIAEQERFLTVWHRFCKKIRERMGACGEPGAAKALTMYVLKRFFLENYGPLSGFYGEFYIRLEAACGELGFSVEEIGGETGKMD